MPRFVVLEHDHPVLHWDFMLEAGATLRSWRLAEFPEPERFIVAESIGDHRLAYLDYEGPVSGGRGCVKRCDTGTFDWIEDSPQRVVVRLHGTQLQLVAVIEDGTVRFSGYPLAPDRRD
jgi:hypothetical protein